MNTGVRLMHRIGWGVSDQILSSLTNFGLSILAIRFLDPRALGAFSGVYATYLLLIGAQRALVGEPILVMQKSGSGLWRLQTAWATGFTLTLALTSSFFILICSAWLTPPMQEGLLALSVMLPGLLLQDSYRFAFFAARRPQWAFFNDLVWLALMVISVGILLAGVGNFYIWMLVGAWGVSGSISSIVGALQARAWPSVRSWRAWWSEASRFARPFFLEFLLLSGSAQLVVFGVGAISGLAVQGVFFSGLVLMAPPRVLFTGTMSVLVPEAVRARDEGLKSLRRLCNLAATLFALLALTWGLLVRVVPEMWAELLFGSAFEPARTLATPLSIMIAGNGVVLACLTGLRALHATDSSRTARMFSSISYVAGGVIGTFLGDELGAAWGVASASSVSSIFWYWQILKSSKYSLITEDD